MLPPLPASGSCLAAAALMFCLTVLRFCYARYTLLYQFASLTYAISTAASYHKTHDVYKFTLYW